MLAGLTKIEILDQLRAQIAAEGGTTAWARRHDVLRGVLTEVLAQRRDIPDSIANAMGFVTHRVFLPVTASARKIAAAQGCPSLNCQGSTHE